MELPITPNFLPQLSHSEFLISLQLVIQDPFILEHVWIKSAPIFKELALFFLI